MICRITSSRLAVFGGHVALQVPFPLALVGTVGALEATLVTALVLEVPRQVELVLVRSTTESTLEPFILTCIMRSWLLCKNLKRYENNVLNSF